MCGKDGAFKARGLGKSQNAAWQGVVNHGAHLQSATGT
jgi:hypothetical protein